MTDVDLFAWGCGVSFVALGGAYAFLRDRFLEGTRRASVRIDRERKADLKRGRAPGRTL